MIRLQDLQEFEKLQMLLQKLDPASIQFPATIYRTEGRMSLFQANADIEYYTYSDSRDCRVIHFESGEGTADREKNRREMDAAFDSTEAGGVIDEKPEKPEDEIMKCKQKAKQIRHILRELVATATAINNLAFGIMFGEGGYSATQFLIRFAQNDARDKILQAFDIDIVSMDDSAFEDARAALLSAYPEHKHSAPKG